ncbi:CDP-alcohol phosphatidyltransferase [Wuchereria bancrofti]|uniref:CDP-alcohol phosphatidyltransferase n=1 Tax=Wuchereria bancrofti TaxID=6293 RepID=J9FGP2_WUCBA|nr:CDP-alcohol phosphatidyltransferase [Wuchereria bancrofti]
MEYVKWSVRNAWEDYLEGDCQLRVAQMNRLREHKYSAVDISWLDEYCMKRFWEYVVRFYPMWISPNVITISGFFINLVTVLILACFSYDAKVAASSWAYFQAALGVFLYQTLDATDGKQARRTGSSSPLGELLDHGCDAMSQVLVTLNICYAMLLGQERYMVLFVTVLSVVLFYCAHWSTYCTGRLKFAKLKKIVTMFCFCRFDVTEAQMTILVVLLMTSIFGTGFWTEKFLHISLKHVAIFISSLMCMSQIGDYLVDVVTEGVGKNGSTVADTSVLSPLIPLLMMITPFCMIYSKSVTAVYDDHITLFTLCLGAVSTKATMRLILAHMSRSELAMWDWIYLSPLMMMLNQYYDMPLDEFYLLLCATVYAYASLSLYCVMIIRQLCAHLRVYCFSLKPLNEPLEKMVH